MSSKSFSRPARVTFKRARPAQEPPLLPGPPAQGQDVAQQPQQQQPMADPTTGTSALPTPPPPPQQQPPLLQQQFLQQPAPVPMLIGQPSQEAQHATLQHQKLQHFAAVPVNQELQHLQPALPPPPPQQQAAPLQQPHHTIIALAHSQTSEPVLLPATAAAQDVVMQDTNDASSSHAAGHTASESRAGVCAVNLNRVDQDAEMHDSAPDTAAGASAAPLLRPPASGEWRFCGVTFGEELAKIMLGLKDDCEMDDLQELNYRDQVDLDYRVVNLADGQLQGCKATLKQEWMTTEVQCNRMRQQVARCVGIIAGDSDENLPASNLDGLVPVSLSVGRVMRLTASGELQLVAVEAPKFTVVGPLSCYLSAKPGMDLADILAPEGHVVGDEHLRLQVARSTVHLRPPAVHKDLTPLLDACGGILRGCTLDGYGNETRYLRDRLHEPAVFWRRPNVGGDSFDAWGNPKPTTSSASDEANCKVLYFRVRGVPIPFVVTTRFVAPGEPFTLHRYKEYWADVVAAERQLLITPQGDNGGGGTLSARPGDADVTGRLQDGRWRFCGVTFCPEYEPEARAKLEAWGKSTNYGDDYMEEAEPVDMVDVEGRDDPPYAKALERWGIRTPKEQRQVRSQIVHCLGLPENVYPMADAADALPKNTTVLHGPIRVPPDIAGLAAGGGPHQRRRLLAAKAFTAPTIVGVLACLLSNDPRVDYAALLTTDGQGASDTGRLQVATHTVTLVPPGGDGALLRGCTLGGYGNETAHTTEALQDPKGFWRQPKNDGDTFDDVGNPMPVTTEQTGIANCQIVFFKVCGVPIPFLRTVRKVAAQEALTWHLAKDTWREMSRLWRRLQVPPGTYVQPVDAAAALVPQPSLPAPMDQSAPPPSAVQQPPLQPVVDSSTISAVATAAPASILAPAVGAPSPSVIPATATLPYFAAAPTPIAAPSAALYHQPAPAMPQPSAAPMVASEVYLKPEPIASFEGPAPTAPAVAAAAAAAVAAAAAAAPPPPPPPAAVFPIAAKPETPVATGGGVSVAADAHLHQHSALPAPQPPMSHAFPGAPTLPAAVPLPLHSLPAAAPVNPSSSSLPTVPPGVPLAIPPAPSPQPAHAASSMSPSTLPSQFVAKQEPPQQLKDEAAAMGGNIDEPPHDSDIGGGYTAHHAYASGQGSSGVPHSSEPRPLHATASHLPVLEQHTAAATAAAPPAPLQQVAATAEPGTLAPAAVQPSGNGAAAAAAAVLPPRPSQQPLAPSEQGPAHVAPSAPATLTAQRPVDQAMLQSKPQSPVFSGNIPFDLLADTGEDLPGAENDYYSPSDEEEDEEVQRLISQPPFGEGFMRSDLNWANCVKGWCESVTKCASSRQ